MENFLCRASIGPHVSLKTHKGLGLLYPSWLPTFEPRPRFPPNTHRVSRSRARQRGERACLPARHSPRISFVLASLLQTRVQRDCPAIRSQLGPGGVSTDAGFPPLGLPRRGRGRKNVSDPPRAWTPHSIRAALPVCPPLQTCSPPPAPSPPLSAQTQEGTAGAGVW